MLTIIISVAVLLAALPAHAVQIWLNPAEEPFTGDFAAHIRQMPISTKNRAKLIQLVTDAVVTRTELGRALTDDSQLTAEERARWLQTIGKDENQFYVREELEIRGLSQSTLTRAFATKRTPLINYLRPGDMFVYMAYGKNKVWRDEVMYQPGPGVREKVNPIHRKDNELKTYVFVAEDEEARESAVLIMPTVCRNLALQTRALGLTLEHPAPKPPTPAGQIKVVEPTATVTFHAYIVTKDPLTEQLARLDGRQSRDLGDEILKAIADGRTKLSTKCTTVEFEFETVNYAVAAGSPILEQTDGVVRKGSIPTVFDPRKRAIQVERICGGHTSITVTPTWIDKPLAALAVRVGPELSLHYPPNRELFTCASRNDEKRCGKPWPHEWGELYWRLNRIDPPPAKSIEFYFVTE